MGNLNDHDIHIYDAATGVRKHVLPGQNSATATLRFTPDSKTLLTGDTIVRFWDVATGQQLHRTEGHENYVTDLVFVGKTIVTTGADGTIRTWNPTTGEQLKVASFGTTRALRLKLSHDGKRVCSVQADGVAVVAEVATGAEVARVDVGTLSQVQFTPTGDGLRSSGWTHDYVQLTFGRPAILKNPPSDQLMYGGFSPDGATAWRVVSAAPKPKVKQGFGIGPQPPYEVVLSNFETGIESGRFRLPENSTFEPQPAWSPDGKLLAVSNYHLSVWDVKTGKLWSEFWRGPRLASAPAWSPDGRRIACTRESEILCWDLIANRQAFSLPLGNASSWRIFWSPDGTRIAATTGSTVLVYRVPENE